METASPFIQKVGVVLSGTASQVTVSEARKAPRTKVARILIKGKSTKAVEMLRV